MSFFRELVKTVLKINFAQLARRAGVSQQYISYWMRVDDARLSNIINLLAKIGIKLSCKYDVLPIAPTIINGYNYRLVIHDLGHVGYNTGLDCGIIQKAKTSDSRLHFLLSISPIGGWISLRCRDKQAFLIPICMHGLPRMTSRYQRYTR